MSSETEETLWSPEARKCIDDAVWIIRRMLEEATLAKAEENGFKDIEEDAYSTKEKLMSLIDGTDLEKFLYNAIDELAE